MVANGERFSLDRNRLNGAPKRSCVYSAARRPTPRLLPLCVNKYTLSGMSQNSANQRSRNVLLHFPPGSAHQKECRLAAPIGACARVTGHETRGGGLRRSPRSTRPGHPRSRWGGVHRAPTGRRTPDSKNLHSPYRSGKRPDTFWRPESASSNHPQAMTRWAEGCRIAHWGRRSGRSASCPDPRGPGCGNG